MGTCSGDPLSSVKCSMGRGERAHLRAVTRGRATTEGPLSTKGPGRVIGTVSAADPGTSNKAREKVAVVIIFLDNDNSVE